MLHKLYHRQVYDLNDCKKTLTDDVLTIPVQMSTGQTMNITTDDGQQLCRVNSEFNHTRHQSLTCKATIHTSRMYT